jgi:hypothetical protein
LKIVLEHFLLLETLTVLTIMVTFPPTSPPPVLFNAELASFQSIYLLQICELSIFSYSKFSFPPLRHNGSKNWVDWKYSSKVFGSVIIKIINCEIIFSVQYNLIKQHNLFHYCQLCWCWNSEKVEYQTWFIALWTVYGWSLV